MGQITVPEHLLTIPRNELELPEFCSYLPLFSSIFSTFMVSTHIAFLLSLFLTDTRLGHTSVILPLSFIIVPS